MPTERKRKAKAPPDPRSNHPAIQTVRGIFKRYPRKDQWDSIIAAIGEEPDTELLHKSYTDWCNRDYNPTDIRWITDWYAVRKKRRDERLHSDRERVFAKLRAYFATTSEG